jgi:hypothetical protein
MLAFWLIAAVAAVVTSVGLHEGGSRVTVRAGSPSPVTGTDSSGLVLGGDLRPVPTPGGTPSAVPQPGSWPSATAIAYAARRGGSAADATTSSHAKAAVSPTPRTRASSTAPTRPAKHRRPTKHRPTTPQPTASAPTAAAAMPPGQGHGHGYGVGHGNGVGAPGHGPQAPGNSGH